MIRGGFLSEEDRKALIALARDGWAAGRVTRRANALVLLDKGMSCQEVAEVLLFDDDTIRGWYELFEQSGVEGLPLRDGRQFGQNERRAMRGPEGLGRVNSAALDAPGRRLDRQGIRPRLRKPLGADRAAASPELEYHKPEVISRKLDPKAQKAFIASYENLMNSMGDDEVAMFVDAVHPTHAARPVGCWAPKEQKLAIEQTSGRERINIHGAIDGERPNPHGRSRID